MGQKSLIVILLTVGAGSCVKSYPNVNSVTRYNFEKNIPASHLRPDSVFLIISPEQIDFEPITVRSYMLFVGKSNLGFRKSDLYMTQSIILILPEFTGISDTVYRVLEERFSLVTLTLVYPKSEKYVNIRHERNVLRMHVNVVNK